MALKDSQIDIGSYLDMVPLILSKKNQDKRKTIDKETYSWNDGTINLEIKKYKDIWQGILIYKCSNLSQRIYQGYFSDDLELSGKGTLTITHNGQLYFKVYCQNWRQNCPNGYCIIENSLDDSTYQGVMKQFKKHGLGKVVFRQKRIQIQGLWHEGILRGEVDIKHLGLTKKALYQNNKFIRYIENGQSQVHPVSC